MKKYSNHVIRHSVSITQIHDEALNDLFIVSIDGLPLNLKDSKEQATFKTSKAAYVAAEKAIANANS